jgi:hypothetical protein
VRNSWSRYTAALLPRRKCCLQHSPENVTAAAEEPAASGLWRSVTREAEDARAHDVEEQQAKRSATLREGFSIFHGIFT